MTLSGTRPFSVQARTVLDALVAAVLIVLSNTLLRNFSAGKQVPQLHGGENGRILGVFVKLRTFRASCPRRCEERLPGQYRRGGGHDDCSP
jgi:hypothetical protein